MLGAGSYSYTDDDEGRRMCAKPRTGHTYSKGVEREGERERERRLKPVYQ